VNRQLKPDWRIIFVYLILLILAVPWYWPENDATLLFGMPAWVTIAILVSVLVSIFTAAILLFYRWPGESESDDDIKGE